MYSSIQTKLLENDVVDFSCFKCYAKKIGENVPCIIVESEGNVTNSRFLFLFSFIYFFTVIDISLDMQVLRLIHGRRVSFWVESIGAVFVAILSKQRLILIWNLRAICALVFIFFLPQFIFILLTSLSMQIFLPCGMHGFSA